MGISNTFLLSPIWVCLVSKTGLNIFYLTASKVWLFSPVKLRVKTNSFVWCCVFTVDLISMLLHRFICFRNLRAMVNKNETFSKVRSLWVTSRISLFDFFVFLRKL